MRVNGKTTKCMARANFTTVSRNLLMKENGILMNSMAMGRSITIIRSCLMDHLTIKISTSLTNTGFIMKVTINFT
jgi:hypothetical protein